MLIDKIRFDYGERFLSEGGSRRYFIFLGGGYFALPSSFVKTPHILTCLRVLVTKINKGRNINTLAGTGISMPVRVQCQKYVDTN